MTWKQTSIPTAQVGLKIVALIIVEYLEKETTIMDSYYADQIRLREAIK